MRKFTKLLRMYVTCCHAIIVCRRILQQLDAAVIKERPISNLSVYAEVLQHHHNCVKSAKHFKVCICMRHETDCLDWAVWI